MVYPNGRKLPEAALTISAATGYDASGTAAVLFENTARSMGDIPKEIKLRHIGNCMKADPAYGKGIAIAPGIPMQEIPK